MVFHPTIFMLSNNIFIQSIRLLLFPFAIIYGIVIKIRNLLYDTHKFKSIEFNFPIICVGNIATGGTGKTPMVEYLIGLFKDEFRLAILSRGYKRKSTGFLKASEHISALELGDEPYQFYLKFPDQIISVHESRILAIPILLQNCPNLQAIILDDAFQHRQIKAGLNILLTDYNNLYTKDFYLPTGDLRDSVSSANRAQIVVVTKCPETISEEDMIYTKHKLNILEHQHIFFSKIEYGEPYHLFNPKDLWIITRDLEVLLVYGIANPKPLKSFILDRAYTYYQLAYPDHHIFSSLDMKEIIETFFSISTNNKIILTTEKDAVRLTKFKTELELLPIYVLPIQFKLLNNKESEFKNLISNFIYNFNKLENTQ